MKDGAILILRIGLGAIFIAHGLQKAFGMFDGSGIDGFAGMLSGMGITPATTWAYIVAYVELIGGICVILGLFTRVASFLLLIVMVMATAKIHFANGFFLAKGGFEYNLALACMSAALILYGPGTLSINQKL